DAVTGRDAAFAQHRLHVPLGMVEPARRVRREVGIVAEDLLRRFEKLQLHQQARVADVRMQRVERFPRTQFALFGQSVRRRGETEIDERYAQSMAARAARRGAHRTDSRTRAGLPYAIAPAGISVMTTAPAPITAPAPMVMWGMMLAPVPMNAAAPTVTLPARCAPGATCTPLPSRHS